MDKGNVVKFEAHESQWGSKFSYAPMSSTAERLCKLMGYDYIPSERDMDKLYEILDELGVEVLITYPKSGG